MHSRFSSGWRTTIMAVAMASLVLLPYPATPAEPVDGGSKETVAEKVSTDTPDMRFSTLEDIYGEAGDKFQAAVGIINQEKPAEDDPDPAAGFGLSVDDMVIEWREFFLDDDNNTCSSGGECAVIDRQTDRFFEGNSR